MSIHITCIRKDNGNHENNHTAIKSLDWTEDGTSKTGTSTRIEMYDWIKDQSGVAHVRDKAGNEVRVGTAITDKGTKYVRTYADKIWTDNLLALPEC
jgi:hypothetical protein